MRKYLVAQHKIITQCNIMPYIIQITIILHVWRLKNQSCYNIIDTILYMFSIIDWWFQDWNFFQLFQSSNMKKN